MISDDSTPVSTYSCVLLIGFGLSIAWIWLMGIDTESTAVTFFGMAILVVANIIVTPKTDLWIPADLIEAKSEESSNKAG